MKDRVDLLGLDPDVLERLPPSVFGMLLRELWADGEHFGGANAIQVGSYIEDAAYEFSCRNSAFGESPMAGPGGVR